MTSYKPSDRPNTRIDVADILRGIAIGGIVLIHFIEHLNFYNFPEPSNEFWAALNQGVWDTTFFLLAGKMYAIFAMLFGLFDLLFYNWGFGLYRHCGHTASLLIGMGFVILQYIFCRWWLSNHRRGPFEELWSRATWLGRN